MKFNQFGLLSKEDVTVFNSIYAEVANKFVAYVNTELGVYPSITSHILHLLDSNVPNGKRLRGLLHLATYKSCAINPSKNDLRLASVAGWLIEMLQGAFLIADDIMDRSDTRRGEPCWYKNSGIGIKAVSDARLLEQATYFLLKVYFGDMPCYHGLERLFRDAVHKTVLGQSEDLQTWSLDVFQERFSAHRYATIVKLKTSYYTIRLPILTGLLLAEKGEDVALTSRLSEIALRIGHYFQAQDDFLDCFGDDKVTGKVGSDIQDGKCTWLIVTAIEKAGPEEVEWLKNNYGRDEPDCVEKVVELYRDLNLVEMYHAYEEKELEELTKEIRALPEDDLQDILFSLVSSMYKRAK